MANEKPDVERMLFRALERVRDLGGDTWMAVFDQEMLDWSESHWTAMDPDERAEWEHHRKIKKLLDQSRDSSDHHGGAA